MVSVMLVDDDMNLQRVYKTLFTMNGLNIVAQAYDGLQALEIYRELDPKPDAVLMDQRMPRMDGVTATHRIKELDHDAKIIFLSADDTAEKIAMNSGATLFLTKPIQIETLLDSIRKIAKC
jgi:two-component system, chemotaxis family, chemotaxis protein CheY